MFEFSLNYFYREFNNKVVKYYYNLRIKEIRN